MLTEQQFINRANGLGGSDIGAICGESKWGTPLSVYQSKTQNKSLEELRSDYQKQFCCGDTNIGVIGNLLEKSIKDLYTFKTGLEIVDDEQTHEHKEYPFLLANVDGWIKDTNTLIECKSAYIMSDDYGDEDSYQIPNSYYLQCAHYRMITNAEEVVIAVLFGNHTFKTFSYKKNEELENNIKNIAVNFWNTHVLAKVPPEPSSYKESTEFYKRNKQSTSVCDEYIFNRIQELKQLKEQKKENEKLQEKICTEISNFMGESHLLTDAANNTLVKFSEVNSNRFDSKKFKAENSDLYNNYCYQSSYQRMTIAK